MSTNDHAHHGPAYKTYWAVFIWLGLLTFLTVAVSWVEFPAPIAVGLAFMIAISKASIVAAFFMHLKYDSPVLRIVCSVPAILTILIIFALMPDVGLIKPGVAGPPRAAKMIAAQAHGDAGEHGELDEFSEDEEELEESSH